MNPPSVIFHCVCAATFVSCMLRCEEAVSDAELTALIEKLGADDFETREKATSALKIIAGDVVNKLERARKATQDSEVRIRLSVVLADYQPGAILWQFRTERSIVASPAIVDERVHFGSFDGTQYCLNAKDGKLIWRFEAKEDIRSSPAVSDGRVYFGSLDKHFYCLEAATGALVWSFQAKDAIYGAPIVSEGSVYFCDNSQMLHSLDAKTGAKIWEFQMDAGAESWGSCAIDRGQLFIGGDGGTMHCFEAKTGKLIWKFAAAGSIHSVPALTAETVLVPVDNVGVLCCDRTTGKQLWKKAINTHISSTAVAGERVIVGGHNSKVYALSLQDGSDLWTFSPADQVQSSPCVVEGRVFVGSYDKHLYCLDAQTGAEIWKLETGSQIFSSPAVAGGRVYIGSYDSKLYCIRAGVKGPAEWPMFGLTPRRTRSP